MNQKIKKIEIRRPEFKKSNMSENQRVKTKYFLTVRRFDNLMSICHNDNFLKNFSSFAKAYLYTLTVSSHYNSRARAVVEIVTSYSL